MTTKRTTKKAPAKAGASAPSERMNELIGLLDRKVADLQRQDNDKNINGLLLIGWAMELEELREQVQSGESDAFLRALQVVSHEGMEMPDWLGDRLNRAISAYRSHKVRTLDEAFSTQRPKGYHRKASQDRWQKAPMIVFDVLALHAHGIAIGDGMFDELANIYGLGKTKVSEFFYFHQRKGTGTYRAAKLISQPSRELRSELLPAFLALRKKADSAKM